MHRGIIARVDIEFHEAAKDFSKKLNIGYREATREMARILKYRRKDVKINF